VATTMTWTVLRTPGVVAIARRAVAAVTSGRSRDTLVVAAVSVRSPWAGVAASRLATNMVLKEVTEMGAMVALVVTRGVGTRGASARMEIPSLWVATGPKVSPPLATVRSTGASLPRGGLSNRRGKKPRGGRRRRPGRRVTNSRELEVAPSVLSSRDHQRERDGWRACSWLPIQGQIQERRRGWGTAGL
jgi:hypothetical protein